MTTIDMVLKNRKVLSAEEYLNLSRTELDDIKDSRIVPPQLGGSSFGGIEVVFRTPHYEAHI